MKCKSFHNHPSIEPVSLNSKDRLFSWWPNKRTEGTAWLVGLSEQELAKDIDFGDTQELIGTVLSSLV